MASINYREAIKNISDFIIDTCVTEFNEKDEEHTLECSERDKIGKAVPIAVDGTDASEKCWTFEIPFLAERNIMTVSLRIKKSIFLRSGRSTRNGFKVIMSYPGQTLKAQVLKYNWKHVAYERNHGSFKMIFNIQNMVVLKKRNRSHQPCHPVGKLDDLRQRDLLIKTLGCRPVFITSSSEPQCNSGTNITNSTSTESEINYVSPCNQVEKIFYTYDEGDALRNEPEPYFDLNLNFQGKTYMEIKQTRDYDLQSLIGNAGGYLGLFLGVCLLQLPQLLLDGYNFVKGIRHYA